MMKRKKMKIGIIGCGTIGTEIARACGSGLKESVSLAALCDIDRKKADGVNRFIKKKAPVLSMGLLIKRSDLVVEAASAAVSAGILEKCIRANKDCLLMSVGGLIGKENLLKSASEKGIRVYIPSGAICGIDGLRSASSGNIETVTLTTKKPPKGLEGAPYLINNKIDLSSLNGETVVFDGTAAEAVKGFPKNVNVCAILSLAGIGARRTRVRIVSSPGQERNIHEIEITGSFGRINTRTENVPSQANPRTSALAVFSAIATLRGIASSVRIGT